MAPRARPLRLETPGREGGSRSATRYLPVAKHGMIRDMHTVALVGTDGTSDWYCFPRFDSPSVFAAILDAEHGGNATGTTATHGCATPPSRSTRCSGSVHRRGQRATPRSLRRAGPVVDQPLEVAAELHPAVVVEGPPVLVAKVDGVHQLAVDVEAAAGSPPHCGSVLAPSPVALQVREFLLVQVLGHVDAVHDLQRVRLRAGRVAEAPLQTLRERAGLFAYV
jgi:hypothetical protein